MEVANFAFDAQIVGRSSSLTNTELSSFIRRTTSSLRFVERLASKRGKMSCLIAAGIGTFAPGNPRRTGRSSSRGSGLSRYHENIEREMHIAVMLSRTLLKGQECSCV